MRSPLSAPTALARALPALLDEDRPVTAVHRLRGGTKKGVYRLTLGGAATVIAYLWHPDEDHWPTTGQDGPDPADPFSHASGPDLFAAAHTALTGLGVRVPRLLAQDTTGAHHPGAIALVEDVTGPTLEDLLHRDPDAAAPVLDRLGDALRTMHGHTHPHFGKVAHLASGGRPHAPSCDRTVLDRALTDLDEAAARDARARADHARLTRALHTLASRVAPRAEHVLVHGELGPDHVLVAPDGAPVLIDIEGLMFFDAEWEHAFLKVRFGEHHPRLRTRDPDPHRGALYDLATHLSLVAGPLRLLDGDFPDRAFMRGIVEHHLAQALRTTA